MIVVSIGVHVALIGAGILLATLRSPAGSVSAPGDAPVVDLYDLAELPEMPAPEVKPAAPKTPDGDVIAFQNISAHVLPPTPTPKLIPTPTPKLPPTPTPKLIPMPTPTPKIIFMSTPRPMFTPQPRPTLTPTPPAALEIPKRPAVMPSETFAEHPWPAGQKEQSPGAAGQPSGAGKSNTGVPGTGISGNSSSARAGMPMTFETENEFPYPDYLEHIKAKIEGLWFPEGTGTISIYLIIEKDGKILKSGVDKGTGLDVSKLRESIIRALELVKRFNPLPEDYQGMVLRVRITVRR